MESMENRREAKLKKLASMNEKRILKSINQNQTKKNIDLRATEKAFLGSSPTSMNMKTPISSNITITTESTSSPILSFDEKADKQMVALATWTNTMIGLDSSEEIDLGATAAEACRRIQKILSKKTDNSPTDVESLQATTARRRYQRIFEKNDSEKIKKKCRKLLEDLGMENIRDMLSKDFIAIRKEHSVYSDLSLQTTLLRIFLSFHPAWLKAALEAVFDAKIDAQPKFMIRALSQFLIERVFSNPTMLKNKKFAQGSGVPIITAAGKEALHRHFLEVTMKILYLIQKAHENNLIPNLHRIFTKSSHFKSFNGVFTELTRELLTGSSADFKKACSRIGFQTTYEQPFFESYNYHAKNFGDFSDGLILAKLIETVGEMPHGKLLRKLRDPAGDRIRKVKNVETVLQEMSSIGINTEDVTAAAIVGGKKDAILAILWSIVGVRVAKEKRIRYSRAPDSSSQDLTTPKKKRRSAVHDDMSSEVLKSLKVIGRELNQEVLDLDSLIDGLLLEKIWTTYVPNGTPIQSYSGHGLWEQIVSLAELELGIPRGLDQNVALFVKMFLERTQMVRMYNEKAATIQKMWRSYLERKKTPKLYHVVQQALHECRTARSLSPLSMSQLAENATFTVHNGVTPRESIQNDSTFNDATFTVSRDSIDSLSGVFKMPRTPIRGTFTRNTIAKHLNEVIEEEEEATEMAELTKVDEIPEEDENVEMITGNTNEDKKPEEKEKSMVEETELPTEEKPIEKEELSEENDETMVPSTLKKRFRFGHVEKTVFQEDSDTGVTTIEKTSVFRYSEVLDISSDMDKENSENFIVKEQVDTEDQIISESDNSNQSHNNGNVEAHSNDTPVESQASDDFNDVEMMDVSDDVQQENQEIAPAEDHSIVDQEDREAQFYEEKEDVVEPTSVPITPGKLRTPIPTPRSTISSPLPLSMEATQPRTSESTTSTSSAELQLSEDQKKENNFLRSLIENQKRFVEKNNLELTIDDPKSVTNTPELRRILRETRELKRKQEEIARKLGAIEKRALAAKAADEDDSDRSDAGHDDAIILEESEIPEEQLEKLSKSVDFMNVSVEIERKNVEAARIFAETQEKQRVQAEKELKSAVIIQKIVRGFLARRRFRLEILHWRERMIAYNQVLAHENEQFERSEMKDSSVEIKLRNCTLYGLTNDNLHIVHIAATIIDRITDLVPQLLEKFVVELNGIKLIYDILAVADQGFAYTSILHPLLHIVQKCFYMVPEDLTNDTIHPLLSKLTPRLFLLMLKHSSNRDFFIPLVTTLISIGRRFPEKKDSYLEKWENPIKQTMKKVTDQDGTNYLIILRNICEHLL